MLFPIAVAVSYLTGAGMLYLTTMLSVCVHEAGHIAAAMWLGGVVSEIRILPYGLSAAIKNGIGMTGRLAVYLGGPVTSMLLFAAFKAVSSLTGSRFMAYAANVNLFVALINMFPALPLDGGKLLREILGTKVGMNAAGRHLRTFSFFTAAVAVTTAIANAIYGRFNISLWAAAFFIIVASSREKAGDKALSLVNILKRRSRPAKKGIYTVRHIAALSTVKLGEIIGHIDFDRFHIVYVLNPDASIKGEYTEQQLVDGALEYGSGITLDEYIRKSKTRDSI